MSCLMRNKDLGHGKPTGTLTTNTDEIDQILHETWDKITSGGSDDLDTSAHMFINKYHDNLHKAPEWHIGDLTFKDFKDICKEGTDAAAGLDGWAARDIALMSDKAIQLMVDLLNSIEQGAPWPEHMLATRAVFLSKNAHDTANPVAHRILKIISGWYRKWASCRVRNLQGWIATWDNKYIKSGVPGKGAQDAWLQTALQLELDNLTGLETAGGSVDIYKCFDQINRKLVLRLATEAGMPLRILEPYFRYIDNLQVQFQIGKTIGARHEDRCSIPQGCPFSMTMIALLLVPWTDLMNYQNVTPRVLADDLMFTTSGEGHFARTIRAMRSSRIFSMT